MASVVVVAWLWRSERAPDKLAWTFVLFTGKLPMKLTYFNMPTEIPFKFRVMVQPKQENPGRGLHETDSTSPMPISENLKHADGIRGILPLDLNTGSLAPF